MSLGDHPKTQADWVKFIYHACQDPKVREVYRQHTLQRIEPFSMLVIEMARLDPYSQGDAIRAFIMWATSKYWGLQFAPSSIQDAYRRLELVASNG